MLTVLMSCYNSARFLPQAIESVLAQTHRDFEFLIIDDGSTDNTPELCRTYAARDGRIRLILHKVNRGAPTALNEAMNVASHDWLFRFDPDDVMLPDRLEKQLRFLRQNPDLSVASGLGIIIDSNDKVLGKSRSPYTTRQAVAATVAGPSLVGFLHPAAAMRKSAVLSVGGYRPDRWPVDDLDLWNRLAEAGHQMLVQEEYLIQYRQHSGSISAAANRKQVQAVEWTTACKACRRQNVPEPSFQEFMAAQAAKPMLRRWNQQRKIQGYTLYKTAVFSLARGDRLRFATSLLAAGLFTPGFVLSRVLPRVFQMLQRQQPGASGQ